MASWTVVFVVLDFECLNPLTDLSLFQQIKKDLKKYSKIFEQKDRLSQSKASKVSLIPRTVPEWQRRASGRLCVWGRRGQEWRVASPQKTLAVLHPCVDWQGAAGVPVTLWWLQIQKLGGGGS